MVTVYKGDDMADEAREILVPALKLPEYVQAEHVEPGTTYADEPGEAVPAGWWVIGHDDPWEPHFQIHIDTIEDANGNDVTEPIAKLIASVLEEASLLGSEQD